MAGLGPPVEDSVADQAGETGSPTITLPGGFTGAGLPIGIQLIAPHLHEPRLCSTASAFQGITAWHRRHPPI